MKKLLEKTILYGVLSTFLLLTSIAQERGYFNDVSRQGQSNGILQGLQTFLQNLQSSGIPRGGASPSPRGPINQIPDKRLGMCRVPLPISDLNIGQFAKSCEQGAPESIAANFLGTANDFIGLYDRMLDPALNPNESAGLSCLRKAKQEMVGHMEKAINQLQKRMDYVKKRQAEFKRDQEKLLLGMGEDNCVLNGKNAANGSKYCKNHELEKFDFFKAVNTPSHCQHIDFGGKLNMDRGLNGLKKNMDSLDGKSTQLLTNVRKYELDINWRIKEIKKRIQQDGVAFDWKDMAGDLNRTGRTRFAKIDSAYEESRKSFQKEYDKIKKQLVDMGHTELPPLDETFQGKLSDFLPRAQEYLENKYVDNCFYTKTSRTLSGNIILNNLTLNIGGSSIQGTTVDDYKSSLVSILNEDSFMSEKLEKIKALDNGNGNSIVIKGYQDAATGVRKKISVSKLYEGIIEKCQQSLVKGEKINTTKAHSTHVSDHIKAAIKNMERLKEQEKRFASDLERSIIDRVILCDSNEMAAGDCNQHTLNVASAGFCIKHASLCANQVKSCYKSAEALIEKKTTALQEKAAIYNLAMKNFTQQQQLELEGAKREIEKYTSLFQQAAPDVVYNPSKDMIITEPKVALSSFGVKLEGGDDINTQLKKLPQKLAQAKKQVDIFKKSVASSVQKHINQQVLSIKKDRDTWESLKAQCKNHLSQLAQVKQARAEALNKEMEDVHNFCSRYESMMTGSPAAGCSEDFSPKDLYEDASRLIQYLNPYIPQDIGAYQQICNAYNNDEDGGIDDDNGHPLENLCEKHGNWDAILGNLVEDIAIRLPPHISSNEIKKYIQGKGDQPDNYDELSDFIKNQISSLKNIEENVSFNNYKEDFDSAIQNDLNDIKSFITNNCVHSDHGSTCNSIQTALGSGDYTQAINLTEALLNKDNNNISVELEASMRTQIENVRKLAKRDKLASEYTDYDPSSKDYCRAMKQEKINKAVSRCIDDDNPQSCYSNKVDEIDLTDLPNSRRINRLILSISPEKYAAYDWQEMGEVLSGEPCASFDQGARGNGPSIFEGVEDTLNRLPFSFDGLMR